MTLAHGEHDFETYSSAGLIWDDAANKWLKVAGSGNKKGLSVVGAAAYSEHPSTDILTYSYQLPGQPKRRWRPGQPNPQDLFDYLAAGGVLEAHKADFEERIWANVAVRKYGWPPLPPYQLRCSMATARVNSYPGALADLSDVLALPVPKDADGKRLLDKFSVPRNPTKTDGRRRIVPDDDPVDGEKLYGYCDTDLDAERGASDRMSPMTPDELLFWWVDQEINRRGIGIDRPAIRDCIAVMEAVFAQYSEECRTITGGLSPSQGEAVRGWLAGQGVHLPNMRAETVQAALGDTLELELDRVGEDDDPEEEPSAPLGHNGPPVMSGPARRVLEIRALTASASVKKLYAMENQGCRDNRLRDLITHHGARTGRPTGNGPQPLNLPKAGPTLAWCRSDGCNRPFRPDHRHCPWCSARVVPPPPPAQLTSKWPAVPKDLPKGTPSAIETVLLVMSWRSLDLVEWFLGDALLCISGCVRGMFEAAEGHDLIASDYNSIEAVVIACLAGEEWRIEAFKQNLPMYLLSASKVTGIPLAEYLQYFEEKGDHHPHRQKIGKVNELANGFGGWINSSKAFGSTEPDAVIKEQIKAWRAASPAIVELWGGQFRGAPWEERAVHVPAIRCYGQTIRAEHWADPTEPAYFGYEGAAVQALMYPGQVFDVRGVTFQCRPTPAGPTALYIRLLSGRELTYHQAQLVPATRAYSRKGEYSIVYMTWNSNPKYGARGWWPMNTYGGRLTENIVQATAHDVLRYAILATRAAGYPTVLHVYDEVVAEIPKGAGSIEELERIMSTMPAWAADWPIKAHGGWRGRRYRKG